MDRDGARIGGIRYRAEPDLSLRITGGGQRKVRISVGLRDILKILNGVWCFGEDLDPVVRILCYIDVSCVIQLNTQGCPELMGAGSRSTKLSYQRERFRIKNLYAVRPFIRNVDKPGAIKGQPSTILELSIARAIG